MDRRAKPSATTPVTRRALSCLVVVCLVTSLASAENGKNAGDWLTFGADLANTKYSPLSQIDAENFEDLEIAWRWESISQVVAAANRRVRPGQFKPTPLVVGGVLYLATEVSQVVALEGRSGEMLWSFDPQSYEAGRPANVGFQHRGVAYWSDGERGRILIATHDRKLIALDAKTGKTFADFGEGGAVDLTDNLGRKVNPRHITHSSPPAICGNTVIVGSIVHDGPTHKEAPPGHVRGFDVLTGEMKWIFHTIPQNGEAGNDTWEDGSWEYSGASNVWSMMAVDEELGYAYLPTGTPTNDMYGGHRLGDNLFAESLICVECETGERVWHFQAVHHGVWDYDLPTAPNLVDITVDGKRIPAVVQVSKQAFTYVLDRRNGKPVWPIEERPVPQSDVPGERSSATQPFPTKPKAFDHQGVTEDDLIDLTPALKKEALEIAGEYTLGPLYTPPVTRETSRGTLISPSPGGGANWPGAAVDPESGWLYVPSSKSIAAFPLIQPDQNRSNLRYVLESWLSSVRGPQGLPLLKPPYGRVTAIDLNTGEHVWMTPHGDGPRNHPALKDLDLGPLGSGGGGPLVTKTLLIVSLGASLWGDQPSLIAYDKKTGAVVGRLELPSTPHGNPVSFDLDGKQFLAVAVGGGPFFSLSDEEIETMAADFEGVDAATLRAQVNRGTKPELIVYRLP